MKIAATNPKAIFNYSIVEKMEAGLVLLGLEIKAIRAGRVSIGQSFVRIKEDGAYLYNMIISPLVLADRNFDPQRPKKLLLKKAELLNLRQKLAKNLTAVPLRVYITHNLAKVEIAVVRGKKAHEKKETEKKREMQREIEREMGLIS